MKRFTTLLISMIASIFLLVAPAAPATAQLFEGSVEEACKGANLSNSSDCREGQAERQVNNIIADGLNIFSLVIGVIGVIMVMVGGIRFVTSGGDSNAVSSARNTILYAVIGLVIAAVAQVIVRFVLSRV